MKKGADYLLAETWSVLFDFFLAYFFFFFSCFLYSVGPDHDPRHTKNTVYMKDLY